ncbi:MAG: 7-cyano-7-deazaguanine synthase QueC [Acidimicrobiales bacterium]|nr:7-cyano-7-deazaguanine synthase QueC [Acidimicrobiales bacterium]
MIDPTSSAVVLLSGGQDSTTCLAWALHHFDRVKALAFDYGQRHAVELDSAQLVADEAGVDLEVVAVEGLRGSSLTDHDQEVTSGGGMHGLPSTFTPGRNLVFLALSVGVAVEYGAENIVTGICQTDYSGYPDCRERFRGAMEGAIRAALDADGMIVHAPLMSLTKAETVDLAVELEALPLLAHSHTCYHGQRPACGDCPACELRLRGFEEAGVDDPIPYLAST